MFYEKEGFGSSFFFFVVSSRGVYIFLYVEVIYISTI